MIKTFQKKTIDNRFLKPLKAFKWIFYALILLTSTQTGQCLEEWVFEITPQCRPGTYWWCPGSAFDKESINWNLDKMKDAGFGTVHIIPIYGARGYENSNIEYLSPTWMEMYEYIVLKAEHLGIRVDMITGTGRCFGGPNIPQQYRDTHIRWQNDRKDIVSLAGMRVKRACS